MTPFFCIDKLDQISVCLQDPAANYDDNLKILK